jgi:hypothetical protein
MSYTPEELLKIAVNYDEVAVKSFVAEAKKKEKKLDPKAKVRNRGTVCVPAASAKDKQDHFPINDEGQARNALARVQQFKSVPEWYKGSLEGLKALVSRKVHSKYPKIGKSDKKKSSAVVDQLINKYSQVDPSATSTITNVPSHNQPKSPDFFTTQKAFWTPANNLIELSVSLGDANLTNDLKKVLTDLVEKATDVREKGVSGEFDPETVKFEMAKYLANAPGSQLKLAMDKIESKGEGARALLTGRGGFEQFRKMMRQYMAQLFVAAQNMTDAAVSETTARQGAGSPITPPPALNAPAVPPTGTPTTNAPTSGGQRGTAEGSKIQQALNQMGLKGADGKALVVDGIIGKNTNFAIQSFKTEHNMPQATDELAKYYILHPGEAPGARYSTPGTPSTASSRLEDLMKKYS